MEGHVILNPKERKSIENTNVRYFRQISVDF